MLPFVSQNKDINKARPKAKGREGRQCLWKSEEFVDLWLLFEACNVMKAAFNGN